MFDEFKIESATKAVLVSLVCENFANHSTTTETQMGLDELHQLLLTLGVEPLSQHIQNRTKLESATLIGAGKLQEIAEVARNSGANLLVFDCELSPAQVRNIKKITQFDAIDRCQVILEIFARHARTRESKIQIEISRLNYLLPRLTSLWSHFSRQKGGIGVRSGEGEQQLELDRRLIKNRIKFYEQELESIKTSREQQKKKRQRNVFTAALVGYTNAGKSSLMNRLCKQNVLEEDKLFATLDSTFRALNPDSKPPLILIDTVGFISNLPPTLIQGFKSTLESALEADLILIVCDISDPNIEKQLKVTQQVLEELGITEKERIIIFNKRDQLNDAIRAKILKRTYPNSFTVSAFNEEDMKNLRHSIIEYFLSKQKTYDIFIPYERGEEHAKIMGKTNVTSSIHHHDGIYYRIRIPESYFQFLNIGSFVLGPQELKERSKIL